MLRQRRIEYEGAIYHAMARGDRREKIVLDDADRLRIARNALSRTIAQANERLETNRAARRLVSKVAENVEKF